jgi:hypothetical protein
LKEIQNEQREQKEEMNILKDIQQILTNETKENRITTDKETKEMKRTINEINNKTEIMNSRQATIGILIKMNTENIENMNMTKKINEETQKVKKQTESVVA